MPNTLIFRSLPNNENGVNVGSVIASWVPTRWYVMARCIPRDIYIMGLKFDVGYVGSADSTWEYLFEIGFGRPDNAVAKVQIPYSHRNDTAVSYYLDTHSFFLPEPLLAPEATTICVRLSSPIVAGQITHKVKLFYQSDIALVNPSSQLNINNYAFVHGSGNGGECIR